MAHQGTIYSQNRV